MYEKWVVDVSFATPCFVPYIGGELITGMNLVQDHSPGELVGIIHCAGQEAVEAYCAAHPDWHRQFSPPEPAATVAKTI